MSRIEDKGSKANPFAVLFLLLLLVVSPVLVVMLPENWGMLALVLILPAAGITLGFITENVGKDKKFNRKL